MSLNWSVEKVENFREVCYDDTGTLRPVTELLVFSTIHTGLGSITEKNADEFYARMTVIHKMHDIGIMTPNGPKLLDPEHVKAHIGLVANVVNETRAQWVKRNFSDKHTGLLSDYARTYRREIGRQTDAALAS